MMPQNIGGPTLAEVMSANRDLQAANERVEQENAAITGERDALLTAAAGWQALAEKLEACATVFLAEIAIKTGDDGDELTLEFGRLRNREKVIEATHTLFEFPTPADALAAHDREVRAKTLEEAANLIQQTTPDGRSKSNVDRGKFEGRYYAIEQLESMADAAKKGGE